MHNNENRFVVVTNTYEKLAIVSEFCKNYDILWSAGTTVCEFPLTSEVHYFTKDIKEDKWILTHGSLKYFGKNEYHGNDYDTIVKCDTWELYYALSGKADVISYNEAVGIVDVEEQPDTEEITNTKRYETQSGKQLLDVFEDDLLTPDEVRGAYKFNVYKYIQRYQEKQGIKDLEKAQVYLQRLIDFETVAEYNKEP